MATLRRLTPLLGLMAVLAACAPAATGTSPGAPFAIGSRAIVAKAGTTLYVEAPFTLADFNIDPAKLTGAMWVPTGYNATSAVITTKFSVNHLRVPAGWHLKLVQVQVTRTKVAGYTTFSKTAITYTLAALLEITPKHGAVPGPYHLEAELSYQKQSKPLRIDLRLQ